MESSRQVVSLRLSLLVGVAVVYDVSDAQLPEPARKAASFASVDTDGDGRITLSEYRSYRSDPAARLGFFRADADEDGALSEDEWRRHARDEPVPARRLFRGYDADGDERLSENEWLAPQPTESRAEFVRTLKVFDFDADGSLSYEEFAAVPGVAGEHERGAVPDPIEALAQRVARGVLNEVRAPVPADAWPAIVERHLAVGIAAEAALWDRDGDGRIDLDEIRAGIDLAYGVNRAPGVRARDAVGRVWNANYFRSLDADGDGVWSEEEFLSRHPAEPEQAKRQFIAADLDLDGRLDPAEVDKARLSHSDIAIQFLLWDSDRDSLISERELSDNARSWDRNVAVHLLPAFDADGDGHLSLSEFRGTPLGNPLANWNSVRKDANGDGRLDRSEFLASDGLALSGLAAYFFDKFDQDKNGFLDFDEFEFDVDPVHAPDRTLFEALDRDRDGVLTLAETFSYPDPGIAAGEPLLPPYRRIFSDADADSDGRLARDEFLAAGALRRAVVHERWLWRTVLPGFHKADADRDGRVSLAELTAGTPADRHPTLRRDFAVFDDDGSGGLDFTEYACMPAVVQASRRGPVPDPVVDRARDELIQAVEIFRVRDGSHPLRRGEWDKATVGRWFSPYFTEFDRDRDDAVSPEELRAGLEVSFGLRTEDGVELRRDSGHVVNWHTLFHVWDGNGDLRISKEEFVPRFWRGPEDAKRQFTLTDVDQDGFLSPDELAASDFGWVDVIGRFLSPDENLDGTLDPAELERGLTSWERPYLDHLFRGYDMDSDSRLTLEEFRATPPANPVLDWRPRPKDEDGDGFLRLAEFHPVDGLRFLGLSKVFFDRLDRDGSGFLDLSELDFDVDLGRSSSQVVFQALDRNRDGTLTLAETRESLDGSDDPPEPSTSRLRRPFLENDRDGDGALDLGEFTDATSLHAALRAERWRRRVSRPKFLRRDADGDGFVSRDEWLAERPGEEKSEAGYEFVLCDFDGDGRLSFDEFSCPPSVAPADRRGPVPDPVADRVDDLVRRIAQPGSATVHERVADVVGAVSPRDVRDWDSDGDGTPTEQEIRRGVEVLYGVRHPDGTRLRRETGQVFELRTFRAYDRNSDGVLTRAEFAERYWAGREKAEAVFAAADADRDGRLPVRELAGGDVLWADCLSLFRRFDADRNGTLDPRELSAQARPWEAAYAVTAFPAFDADGDGVLSFREFRETPLGNPLADWNSRRADKDHDGQLSLDEFHDGKSLALKGLSSLFLSRLDRDSDGELSVRELEFAVDLRRVPGGVAFTVLDIDGDARLTLAEAFPAAFSPPKDAAARRRHEERMMRVEDAFRVADRDRSGDLSLEEFAAPGALIADVVAGRDSPRRVSARTGGRDAAKRGTVSAGPPSNTWSWSSISLIVFDVLLLSGLIWGGLRWASR